MAKSVRIQNQGKRIIQFGLGKEDLLKPNAVGIFNADTAKKLLKLYPKELLDIDNLQADFDQDKVKDFTAAKENSAKPKDATKPTAKPEVKKESEEGDGDEDALADALKEEGGKAKK